LHLQKYRGAKIEKGYFFCNTKSFPYTTAAHPFLSSPPNQLHQVGEKQNEAEQKTRAPLVADPAPSPHSDQVTRPWISRHDFFSLQVGMGLVP
jgi:hypothetical protein